MIALPDRVVRCEGAGGVVTFDPGQEFNEQRGWWERDNNPQVGDQVVTSEGVRRTIAKVQAGWCVVGFEHEWWLVSEWWDADGAHYFASSIEFYVRLVEQDAHAIAFGETL